MVHIQWTGSNTNNNNNAGQGEAGKPKASSIVLFTKYCRAITALMHIFKSGSLVVAGTDRHNFLQMSELDSSFPLENPTMFNGATVMWTPHGHESQTPAEDIAVSMASSGYYM